MKFVWSLVELKVFWGLCFFEYIPQFIACIDLKSSCYWTSIFSEAWFDKVVDFGKCSCIQENLDTHEGKKTLEIWPSSS